MLRATVTPRQRAFRYPSTLAMYVRLYHCSAGINSISPSSRITLKNDVKKIDDLRKSRILKTGQIFTVADFSGKAESDIEDLFEPDLFVSIVNAAY